MKIIIYGSQKFPDISFENNPKTGLKISTKNAGYFNYEGLNGISWEDFFCRHGNYFTRKIPASSRFNKGVVQILKEELLKHTETKAERFFFEGYYDICEFALWSGKRNQARKILAMPALIPQVWVNWLHYDAADKERADQIKNLPLRVDFLMYWENRWIIIEFDGVSHFSDIVDIAPSGNIRLEGSMEKYTQHLRKDRWLRQQGYEVWRFSDLEIDEIEKDIEFFEKPENNKTGSWRSKRITGSNPWPDKPGYIYELFLNMGINLPIQVE